MIYKSISEPVKIDLSAVVGTMEIEAPISTLRNNLRIYLLGGHLLDIGLEEAPEFFKAWADHNKARETTSILIEDLESPGVKKETFAGLRFNCSGCKRETLLDRALENDLLKGKKIFYNCIYCYKSRELTLEDFKNEN